MRGLQNKVAIVAGAAPGNIGGATALRLALEGMRVTVADFSEAAAQAVVDEVTSAGGSAVARKVDISDEASYRELVDFTAKEFGGLDSLFNVAADLSARTLGRDGNVMSVPIDVWQHTLDVTLTGYMYGVRHSLPLLIERGGGSIVNTSSSSVWMGEPEHVAYQTAKSGLVGLTRHTATLGGKRGVRCNLVAPGVILTKTALRATTEEFRKEILAAVRSPRLGAPEDIAGMVAFLFSDDGAYVNGQTILVDGGAHLT
jgi:NAD(P)-dependent dehydrogenase (short-subunit alcohol dehydrogenase family)